MTTYDYAQLEGLWINAGGSKAMAPIMAAIAMAESAGNSDAYNASGATGLWQILGAVNPADQGNLYDPQVNAKEALLKYKSQGLGAWVTYTSGAYKEWLKQGVTPVGVKGGKGGGTSGAGAGGGTAGTQQDYGSLGVGDVLSGMNGILHDVAVMLDYVFGMFGKGQGWRLTFWIIAVIALIVSVKFLQQMGLAPELPSLPGKVM